jgi:hypothetical protein
MTPRPGDFRRLVLIYGFALLLAEAARLAWLRLDDFGVRATSCASVWGMRIALLALVASFATTALIVARRGLRVHRAGRVPLADDPVLVDTRVRRGGHVALEAGACFVMAAVLLLAPLAVGIVHVDALRVVFGSCP